LPKTDGAAAPERKEVPDSAAAELERLRGENEQLRRMLVDSMLKSQMP